MQKTGNDIIQLPKPNYTSNTSIEEELNKRRSVRDFKKEPLSLAEVAQILWSAQGITDKSDQLRTAPSAGALYPLEIYLSAANVKDLAAGVYKYNPQNHTLKKILAGDKRIEISNASLRQESIESSSALVIIAAIYERTSVKYGKRTERYVNMEVGHVGQNIYLQAVSLGWIVAGRLIQGFGGGLEAAVAYVLVRGTFPERMWSRTSALMSTSWSMSVLIGPLVGGMFAHFASWRGAFVASAATAVVLAIAAFFVLSPVTAAQRASSARVPLGRVALICLAIAATSATSAAGSSLLKLGLIVTAIVSLVSMLRLDRLASPRLLPSDAFSWRTGTGVGLWLALLLCITFSPLQIYVPMFLQQLHGFDPLSAGFTVACASLGWSAASLLTAGVFEHPSEVLLGNIGAAVNVLEAVRRAAPGARLLVVGSAEQYGPVLEGDQRIRETQPFRPASPYAVAKVAQEYLALQYAETWGLDVVLARSFNHSGPGQSDRFVLPAFAAQIAACELGRQEPVLRVGNLEVWRDFLDVRDVVRAYVLLLESGERRTAYNVCRGETYRVLDLLDGLLAQARVPLRVETDPARWRPVDLRVLRGDPGRLRERTGWNPALDMRKTLGDLLDDWRRRTAEAGAS